jgi:hypothetical protein
MEKWRGSSWPLNVLDDLMKVSMLKIKPNKNELKQYELSTHIRHMKTYMYFFYLNK